MKAVVLIAVLLLCSPALAQQQTSNPVVTVPNQITPELLLMLSNERDRQYQQRFTDLEKYQALVAAAAEKAVSTANTANEKRLDSVNEFRGQLKDQTATLLPKAESDVRFKALEERIERISVAFNASTNRFEGAQWLWGALGAVIGGIIVLLTFGLSVRNSFPRKTP